MYVTKFVAPDRLWQVGYLEAQHGFKAMRDCESEEEAYWFIHYLNGGTSGKTFLEMIENQDE